MKFVNLHHHSTFSFGDGFGTPAQHVERAAALGYAAIALTEHGNVSSHFQLEKAANKRGIKAIYGLEAYTGPVEEDRRRNFKYHLTIVAENVTGYRNLNKIVTQSYKDFYYHPTVGSQHLTANKDGLFVLSGCAGSLLACVMLGGKGEDPHPADLPNALRMASAFKETFGDHYFLEVQPFWELDRTIEINTNYEKISKKLDIPIVVTHDVHYPVFEDAEMQAVLHAAHRNTGSVDDQMRNWNYEVPMTLPATDEGLYERLIKTGLSKRVAWNAILNSRDIAAQCNVTLPKAERLRYPIEDKDLEPWT